MLWKIWINIILYTRVDQRPKLCLCCSFLKKKTCILYLIAAFFNTWTAYKYTCIAKLQIADFNTVSKNFETTDKQQTQCYLKKVVLQLKNSNTCI